MKGEERSSLSEFFTHMAKQGHPVQKIKEQLYDIIIKALIMGESRMSSEGKKWLPARGTAYQYYSADFMFDKELKPYLIEMNRFPAYWLAGQYEYFRKHLIDMLNLVLNGLQNEKVHDTLGKEYALGGIVNEFDVIKLANEDLLDLMDGEDELQRMVGTGFTRTFPTSQTSKYWKYLETDIHPYKVQHEWETLFEEGQRADAVTTLRYLYNNNTCSL